MLPITLAIISSLYSINPEKPNLFQPGTSLTVELGWQSGGQHTPDGVRLSIGILTGLKGTTNWAYDISYVSGDDECHNGYCYEDWGLTVSGGLNRYFFITPDRRLYAVFTGGIFAGISHFENGYWYNDEWDDDDTALVSGIFGKASILFNLDPISVGLGLFAGIGPSFGTESGLEIYFPIGMHFTLHWSF
ncbi:MAG: hypothetical protein JXR95_08900 [Deltaproteobacteria bacterium]|nr:hypothetical protein [Deltaproteobacteria bacterium]